MWLTKKFAYQMKILNICLITIIYSMANPSLSQGTSLFENYRWENRLLLFFSSNQNSKNQQQFSIFDKNSTGLKERDILVFHVNDKNVKNSGKEIYGKEEAEQLRRQFQVADSAFSVVLIGKDGTQKLQQEEVLTMDKLFAVVDAMPMRRREMRDH